MLPLHPLTSRLSISMRRGLPAHSFRIASDKEVTLSARRVPLNPDQYFSHPCAHPRILHLVSPPSLSERWRTSDPFLSLSLSLLSTYLFDLCLSTTNGGSFFIFFFSFLFLVNTIRGRGGRYRGEESARRFYRGPFFSRTPRNRRVGRGGNILSLDSIPRERSVAMILEKIGRVG